LIASAITSADATSSSNIQINTQRSGNPFRVRIDVTVPPGHELVADEKPAAHEMHEPLSKVINDAFKTMERLLKKLVAKQRRD
jgi:ribosome-associated translation inhibitor RaiA